MPKEKLTIKQYALRNKMSIFNVVKLIRSEKLETETVEENGRDITYILLDSDRVREEEESMAESERPLTQAEQIRKLKEEIARLEKELERCREGK